MQKRMAFVGAAVSLAIAMAACVGDEPSSSDTSSDGGGSGDGNASTDGNGGGDAGPGTDGSSSSDGGSDAGFPASLPGLALWLEGDFVSGTAGAPVTNWPDQSGNHNDATTSGSAPALLYHDAKFNGHSAVTFQNNNLFLSIADSPTMKVDGTGFLLEIVEAHGSLGAGGSTHDELYSKRAGGAGDGLHAYLSDVGIGAGAGLGYGPDNEATVDIGTLSTTLTNRLRIRFDPNADGGILSAQADQGAAFNSQFDPLPDVTGGTTSATIGALQNNGDAVSIAAIILVKGKVSDADVNNLETYLTTRYGL